MRRVLAAAWRRWKVIAEKIAAFQARLIFTVLYFLLLAPFAIGLKLLADPLRIRKTGGEPGWLEFPRQTLTVEDARKQF